MAQIVDSYSESNWDDYYDLQTNRHGAGQSLTGDGGVLNNCKFYLKKIGSPTGNAYAKIYAHSGTFGTSSVPTGDALATSDAFDVSTLTSLYQLITFIFTGANKITLTNGTKYIVTIEYDNGDADNKLLIGYDSSSPSHGGNASFYSYSSWNTNANIDLCFYVYRDEYIWTEDEKPTTNWSLISKTTTDWTEDEKPTTEWTEE